MAKFVFDPAGEGSIVLGNNDTSNGGYTSLIASISAEKGGDASLQSIKASGTAWGDLHLNPHGGTVTLPPLVIASLPVAPAGLNAQTVVVDPQTGLLYRQ
jgi:hypothetical protein